MNRRYRRPPSLFGYRGKPARTFPAGGGTVCRRVFGSVVSGAAAADDAAMTNGGDR